MITTKQRAYLRGISNKINALYQIGKDGVSDSFIETINKGLEANELLKVHVLENSLMDIKDAANETARKTGADIVQVIGSKFVLYKESVDNKKIELPR